VSGVANVTTAPLEKVHSVPSALSVPSELGMTQFWAAAASGARKQLSLPVSQAQSSTRTADVSPASDAGVSPDGFPLLDGPPQPVTAHPIAHHDRSQASRIDEPRTTSRPVSHDTREVEAVAKATFSLVLPTDAAAACRPTHLCGASS
jgi:hypothetical protein